MPVPAVGYRAIVVCRPHHDMRRARQDLVIASGAPVGFDSICPRNLPNDPFAAGSGFHPRHTESAAASAILVLLRASTRTAGSVMAWHNRTVTNRYGCLHRRQSKPGCDNRHMPTYAYKCRVCADNFELSRPMSESAAPADCPQGHSDTVKLLTTVSMTGRAAGSPAPSGGCCGGGCCG